MDTLQRNDSVLKSKVAFQNSETVHLARLRGDVTLSRMMSLALLSGMFGHFPRWVEMSASNSQYDDARQGSHLHRDDYHHPRQCRNDFGSIDPLESCHFHKIYPSLRRRGQKARP